MWLQAVEENYRRVSLSGDIVNIYKPNATHMRVSKWFHKCDFSSYFWRQSSCLDSQKFNSQCSNPRVHTRHYVGSTCKIACTVPFLVAWRRPQRHSPLHLPKGKFACSRTRRMRAFMTFTLFICAHNTIIYIYQNLKKGYDVLWNWRQIQEQ